MNALATTRRCPTCGGWMRRGEKEETVSYQGHSLTYLQPGWHCENGDDGVLEGPDNGYHDAALHEVMARAKRSPISPLVVRAAREAVGASQREAGRLFGGGPTAFHKYETGKAVPSQGMAKLLRLALERPDLVKASLCEQEVAVTRDPDLLRRLPANEPLGRIVRNVYPAEG